MSSLCSVNTHDILARLVKSTDHLRARFVSHCEIGHPPGACLRTTMIQAAAPRTVHVALCLFHAHAGLVLALTCGSLISNLLDTRKIKRWTVMRKKSDRCRAYGVVECNQRSTGRVQPAILHLHLCNRLGRLATSWRIRKRLCCTTCAIAALSKPRS